MKRLDEIYDFIENYAKEKQLINTQIALPLSKKLLGNISRETFRTGISGATSFEHGMRAAKLLIDIRIMLSTEEEDLMLASMLCLDILDKVEFVEGGQELIIVHQLDSRILEIIKRVARPDTIREEDKKLYYKEIQEDKLSVLVALADRSNLVEQLSELAIEDVNIFVNEMRKYVLPMCVYAKQYYRDCQMSINIMMEKIRCLIDVTDIIANRYQKREMAYNNEILSLMEENARLRGMIRQLEIGEIK